MIEIWSARTTNGLRVSIMLEELGLPYRAHAVDIDDPATKPAEMMAIAPHGAIPVLKDDATGIAMTQSFAIMQHLCEQEGRFLPKEAAARALVLQWMSYVMTDVISATHPIFVLTSEFTDTPAPIIAHYEARLLRFLGQADAQLATTPYLCGEEVTVADFALYPTAAFRGRLLDRAGGLPHLRAWMRTMAARPGVARGMAVP
ncbi:glutathione S-transferase family protein [Roseomonas sp. F4]